MVTRQHGFTFPGRTFRTPEKGLIQAPDTCPPVADGTDPVTGPYEIPPLPQIDAPGARYWVGGECDVWTWDGRRMHVPDDREVLEDLRGIVDEMKRRGARIAYSPGRHGLPDRHRVDYRSPLVRLVTP